MKQPLRLLARFLLLSILFMFVLGTLVVLTRYVSGYDQQRASATNIIFEMLSATRQVFVISLIISASVTIFATIRGGGRPFVPLVLLAVTWTAMLVLGSPLWSGLGPIQADGGASVPANTIIRIANMRIFTPAVEENLASPVLVQELHGQRGIEIFPVGIVRPKARSLTIPNRPDLVLDLAAVEGSYPGMVVTPVRLNPLLRDIGGLNRLMLTAPTRLLAVALGLYLLACWTPARLTRWPLFNAVLVFLCLRGALWLVNSIHFGELRILITTVATPDQLSLVSAGALAFVSLVFLVMLFLMPPISKWKREAGDD